ncbi:RidA family protein [Trinickia terrae]|uniref:RidA family protein n=1 Tax=Trinickia terrae TaxID=2571161 RepID=A0A4U1I971_9BURK|nr:RidA family protein [Trinickia terrae]TKC90041.1 RidA family protein [Trinickia terrae]
MSKRKSRSINIPGLDHGSAPIPMGARVGNMIFSSGIMGRHAETGEIPDDAEGQAKLVFSNLRAFLEQAGASLEDVGHVTAFIRDDSVRKALNDQWLVYFPDPDDRPARHTLVHSLPGPLKIQLEIIAVVGEGM